MNELDAQMQKRQNPLAVVLVSFGTLLVLAVGLFFVLKNVSSSPIVAASLAPSAIVPDSVEGRTPTPAEQKLVESRITPLFLDSVGEQPSKNSLQLLINQVLTPQNLAAWNICGEELAAEATALRGVVEAQRLYPEDRPYALTADAKVDNARWAALSATTADLYEKVAASGTAPKTCTSSVKPAHFGQWLVFMVGGRPLAISDALVLPYVLPVEYHVLQHSCADQLRISRQRTADTAVATVAAVDSESFSEQRKVIDLASYDGQIKLLEANGMKSC